MTAGRSHAFGLPAWLIGAGLFLPPFALPLLLCMVPRPIAPPISIPSLDTVEATRHLQSVSARVAQLDLSGADRALIDLWKRSLGWGASPGQDVAREYRSRCKTIASDVGTDHVLAVGDAASLELVRATVAVELDPGPEPIPFFTMARATGMLDRRGRLRTHPIVILALGQASWREKCGLERELGLGPPELEALDVFLIRFGSAMNDRLGANDRFVSERLRSLDRYAERHPDYPVVPARAAVLLASGDRDRAATALGDASAQRPGDLALGNYSLHATLGER
jgi:hypothetical protein